jgi:hypothetical protein
VGKAAAMSWLADSCTSAAASRWGSGRRGRDAPLTPAAVA